MRNRLLAEIKSLHDEWTLLHEKLAANRNSLIISFDPEQKFGLQKRIDEIMARHNEVSTRLQKLETLLAELTAAAQEDLALISESERLKRALGSAVSEEQRQNLEARYNEIQLRRAEAKCRFYDAEAEARCAVPLTLKQNLPDVSNIPFIGRETELERLDQMLAEDPSVIVQAVSPNQIEGIAGVGKTLLVLVYARRHVAEYQGIFWIDAAGESLQGKLAELARQLRLAPDRAPDWQLAEALSKLLEDGRYLLILDNIDHPTSFQCCIPKIGSSRVIITTRRSDLEGIPRSKQLNLDVLPLDDAYRVLARELELLDESEQLALRTIAEELGCLPMALGLAAKVLSVGTLTPSMLLSQLRTQGPCRWSLRWAQEASSDRDLGPAKFFRRHRCLPELFEASYSLLVNPRSEMLAQVAGFFAPEGIDIELLIDTATRLSTDGRDRESYYPALERIVSLGLAHIDKRRRTVLFHRLVQDFLRDKGGEAAEQAVIDSLATRAQKAGIMPPEILKLGAIRVHLEFALRHIRHEANLHGLWVAIGLIRYLTLVAEYEAAYEMCKRFIASAGDSPYAARLYHQMGWVLMRLSRYGEALRSFRRAHVQWKRHCNEQRDDAQLRHECILTIHDIGLTLMFRGRYHQALPYILADFAYSLGSDGKSGAPSLAMAIAYHTVGVLVLNLGLYDFAESCFHYSLAIKASLEKKGRDIFGANTLYMLGHLYERSGRYDESLSNYRQAMEIRERILSSCHPDFASSLSGVARVQLRKKSEPERALSLLRHTHEIKRRSLPAQHPDLAAIQRALGIAYTQLGEFADARAALDEALSSWEQTLGKDHPLCADGHEALGDLFREMGDLTGARASYERAVQILIRRYGKAHPHPQVAELEQKLRSL